MVNKKKTEFSTENSGLLAKNFFSSVAKCNVGLKKLISVRNSPMLVKFPF